MVNNARSSCGPTNGMAVTREAEPMTCDRSTCTNRERAPIFAPDCVPLTRRQAELIDKARAFGRRVLAPRARKHDREASFPIENFRDMHPEGLLGICVPKEDGGTGADFRTYCIAAAELGRYCGSTALSWNMHVCSTLWSGALTDDLDMTPDERAQHSARRSTHYRRILDQGAIYSQPFSEGGRGGGRIVAFGTEAKPVDGGFLVSGKKIFASLSGAADYYGVLCTERGADHGREPPQHALSRRAGGCARASRSSAIGTARACAARSRARSCSRTCSCPESEMLMPHGFYFPGRPTRWPHMFLTLARPIWARAGGLRFHRRLSARRAPGHAPVKRRMYPTKQIAVAEMRIDARADQGALVPGNQPRRASIRARSRCCAPMPAPAHRDGERQRHRGQGHPHLRRSGRC
jgi:hypothetical protein